jgi:hypothetical protein
LTKKGIPIKFKFKKNKPIYIIHASIAKYSTIKYKNKHYLFVGDSSYRLDFKNIKYYNCFRIKESFFIELCTQESTYFINKNLVIYKRLANYDSHLSRTYKYDLFYYSKFDKKDNESKIMFYFLPNGTFFIDENDE